MTGDYLNPINAHCRRYIMLRSLEEELENIGEMISDMQSRLDDHDPGDEDPNAWKISPDPST